MNSPLAEDDHRPADRTAGLVTIALWITLLGYGAVAAPVPGVNEPHYLGKARHFWDPAWCVGDLLHESSNAHAVFYFVMGFWAKWLTLPQLAWFGRAVGYGILAWGWRRSHHALGQAQWFPWWSLLGFLTLASWGNFSGEWMVGGIEGKVFSYGFLLLAFADWQENRPRRAAALARLAVSFHPIAGGWGVLAALCALGWDRVRNHKRFAMSDIMAAGMLLLAALPGLIPAVQLLTAGDPPQVRTNGTFLQVFYRLQHHLDPMVFPLRSYACYATLCAALLVMMRAMSGSIAGRTWLRMVFWACLFAAGGFLAGYGPRPAKLMPYYLERMNLLKFYPFRLFDVIIPVTAAMQCTAWASHLLMNRSLRIQRLAGLFSLMLLLAALIGGESRRHQMQKATVFDSPEWIDVCHWLRDRIPVTALVQTPVRNQNFKWHAERAEYVAYKDVPQDNAGLVEWNRRMLFLDKWYKQHRADGIYSNDELRALRAEIGITHILTDRLGPFELPACYTNARFRVYDLTTLDHSP